MLEMLGSSDISPRVKFSARPRRGVRIVSVPLGKCLERNSDMGGVQAVAPNSVRIVDAKGNVFRDRCGKDSGRRLRFLRV